MDFTETEATVIYDAARVEVVYRWPEPLQEDYKLFTAYRDDMNNRSNYVAGFQAGAMWAMKMHNELLRELRQKRREEARKVVDRG